MPVNILITGGAGYIGSHTILEILKDDCNVVCVDNGYNSYFKDKDLFPESLKRIQEMTKKKIIFYKIDIRDKTALLEVFKKVKEMLKHVELRLKTS